MRKSSIINPLTKAAALASSLIMCVTLAACSSSSSSDSSKSSSSSSSSSDDKNQIAGVTATGKLGEKPTISFKTPMTVSDGSYVVLQEGDGDVIQDGDRVCAQGIALNVKDGTELMDTWTKNTPDCSLVVSSSKLSSTYYDQIKGAKLNTTIGFGVNDQNTSGYSYIMAMTFVSKSKDLEKATGEEVTDVPANLPKVTRDKDGKPSVDMNGQGSVDKLVTQTLIKGSGKTLTDSDTAVVKYTGWLTNGKQFDSSWDKNTTFDADLSASGQIISGWKQGLIGQTVGSQVLLVIPPDQGYGADGSGDTIPGNSTLVFVIDILAAY
ncbi:FKBP-type peptidyl-prolyl cis-trans isomerase [Bifidobacterium sp. UTBIF-78]|uniref:FKBP-type peptidyl-prolyl cis-trans isomerase n=1 Tax=Bifidobacterium sp. UTBIF-78 TaxID=1465263 RepID=UPI00112AF3E8|nr:FKBP-type peptidyl-prolyl cis-trans isomerase [Bifidobacterium sp. UTBIF-78]TPF92517.1 peptidylprolyl isomerase [Bifidobacterium sp. UTBIF-78]